MGAREATRSRHICRVSACETSRSGRHRRAGATALLRYNVRRMASRLPTLVFRLAVLVALGVSTALLIDYLRPMPAFCDMGSGCEQIRASGRGRLFGFL